MRDEDLNRLHIELAIARARQERAQAVANLFHQVVRAIRNGWVALFGIRRKLPRKLTPLSEDERRALRPPPVAILMNALHAPDRCGDAVLGKYRRLTNKETEGQITMAEGYKTHPDICGGRPVIAGTRFTVTQLLREIASAPGISLDEICCNFGIRSVSAATALMSVASDYEQPR